MKTDKDILKAWAATHGDNEHDIKASLYGSCLMIEFAKYYHKEVVNATLPDNVLQCKGSEQLNCTHPDSKVWYNKSNVMQCNECGLEIG